MATSCAQTRLRSACSAYSLRRNQLKLSDPHLARLTFLSPPRYKPRVNNAESSDSLSPGLRKFLYFTAAITGAGLKELYDEYKKLKDPVPNGLFASPDELTALAVGLVVSALVGYFAIAWLLHYLKRYTTTVFILYRLVLGGKIGRAHV